MLGPKSIATNAIKMKPKVFLAHAKEDARWVRKLYDLLNSIGADPWMAPFNLLPGDQWDRTIRNEIRTAHFVIACLSEKSINKRGYVQREFRLALDTCQEIPGFDRFLIPLRLDPCEVPDIRVGTLSLKELQWVDAFSDGSFAAILKSLGLSETLAARSLLGLLGESTSLLGFFNLHEDPSELFSGVTTAAIKTERISSVFLSTGRTMRIRIKGEKQLSTSETATGVSHVRCVEHWADSSELVVIPEGSFLMGDPEVPAMFQNQLPASDVRLVFVKEFAISRQLITNSQFLSFLSSSGYKPVSDFPGITRKKQRRHPVTNVSWLDANAYCQWADGRLPTESEWEKAARGIDGRPYPWGWEKPHDRYCNFGNPSGGTTPVDRYSKGSSPYGCLDMAGNVWEWCSTQVSLSDLNNIELDSEFKPDTRTYIVRGGSFAHEAAACRSGGRYYGRQNTRSNLWGFRLASDTK
jgi:formylglycine-generating enzyme required for sulfatase activity